MNITSQIFPLKSEQIQKYTSHVSRLYLNPNSFKSHELRTLEKSQKIIITKLYQNLNILCKLTKKQIKQLFKQFKQYQVYQDLLSDFFFDHKINNYMLINKQQANVKIEQNILRTEKKTEKEIINSSNYQVNKFTPEKCVSVEYRLEFTISNINKKKVMKPVVLLAYKLETGNQITIYYSIEKFNELRYEVAEAIKKVYGIELRTMF